MISRPKKLNPAALGAALATLALSGGAAADTVHLKGGGRVKGDVVEYLPGKRVTIKVGAELRSFGWSEVLRVDEAPARGEVEESEDAPLGRASGRGGDEPSPPPKSPVEGGGAKPATSSKRDESGDSVLVVRSTKPETVVGEVTGHSMALAFGAGGSATALGSSWNNFCQAPCEYRLPSGYHELRLDGPGYTTTIKSLSLNPGKTYLLARPGNSTLYWVGGTLAVLGAAAIATGASI